MSSPSPWQRTSPIAALFFLGRILKEIAKNAWQALAPLAAVLFASQGNLLNRLAFAGVALAVGLVVFSVLQYWFFRFRITPDAVLIREGVFQKKQLDIKFRRIQGINTEQNILYRPFGLVTVSFDTAGSSGKEGALPAVPSALADDLHGRISRRGNVGVDVDVDDGRQQPTRRDGEPLLRLDWRDMLRIGLSDRRVLVVLAVLAPLFEQLGDESQRIIDTYAVRAAAALGELDRTTGALVIFGLIVGIVVVLASVSIAAAFLRYHRFRLTAIDDRLQTVGGLLTRHTNSMDVAKVQAMRLHQGMLLRAFARFRAVLRQATSSGKDRESKNMVLPIINPGFVPSLADRAFGPGTIGLDLDPRSARFARISRHYLRPRVLLLGVVPAVAATVAGRPAVGALSLVCLGWLPLAAGLFYLVWRRYGVQFDEESLAYRSGFVGFRLDVFLFWKVQRVTVTQSVLQRRKGLAGLRIYLASGSVNVRYIDYALACRLRDHILWKVESSDRSWH